MKILRLIAPPVAFGAIVLFGAWVCGFDFNERGEKAFTVYFIFLVAVMYGCALSSIRNHYDND